MPDAEQAMVAGVMDESNSDEKETGRTKGKVRSLCAKQEDGRRHGGWFERSGEVDK